MPLDDYNEKMVLTVEGVRVSRHKDIHPEDSDDPADIGLSSEEEADGMDEEPHIRRKYHQAAQPPPPELEQPPAGGPAPSTSTGGDTATIQVPVAALQEVHKILGQIIGGENPQVSSSDPQPQQPEGEIPFCSAQTKEGGEVLQAMFQEILGHLSTQEAYEDPHWGSEIHLSQSRVWEEISI